MHVYCRRHVIERFCVEHEGMNNWETLLRETFNMPMSMCEIKSIMITKESTDDNVCIALTDGADEDGMTYVLKISYDNARKILGQVDTKRVTHLTFHYIESMYTDIIVTHVLPNDSWRAGHDEHPCLPNASPPVSVDVLRILRMIRDVMSET